MKVMKEIPDLCMLLLAMLLVVSAQAGEFHQPRAGLHTGGQPTVEDLAQLHAQGVRTIIDLRGADEDRGYDEAAEVRRLGMDYIPLPIAGKADIVPGNAERLHALLQQHPDGVLLHCASGNRVGALLALSAAGPEHQPPAQALQLGREAGLKSLEPTVREQLGLPATEPSPTP